MDLYKILKVSVISLSLLGIIMVLFILSDNLWGIDGVLSTAYIVLGLAVLTILVRAVLIEMLKLPKNHNIIVLSISFLLSIVTFFWGDFSINLFTIVVILLNFLIYSTLYYLVLRKKESLYFMALFLVSTAAAFIFSDGLDIPMRDGKVLSAIQSNFVSAALYTFYCLILIASGIMLFFGFKNRK